MNSQKSSLSYSAENPCPHKTFLIHDDPQYSDALSRKLTRLGYPNRLIQDPREALLVDSSALADFDVAIVHASLGDRNFSRETKVYDAPRRVIKRIHELAETMRVIVISGAGQVSKLRMLGLEADVYYGIEDILGSAPEAILEIEKGPVNVDEIALRGKEIRTNKVENFRIGKERL